MKHSLASLMLALIATFIVPACDADEPDTIDELRSGSLDLDTLLTFNPGLGETPESVATDMHGNVYVSLALTGEIVRITPAGDRVHHAWLPLGDPADCLGPFPGIMGALAIEPFSGTLFVPVNSCDLAAKGVYRIDGQDQATMIGQLPATALGNGIGLRLGSVFVSDSGSSSIWSCMTSGTGGPMVEWLNEPLLADANPYDAIPGANGLQFYAGKMWVTNASANSLIAIDLDFTGGDVQPNGTTLMFGPYGSGAVWEQDPAVMPGCDDFAFDLLGNVWCTTDPFQTVVRLSVWNGSAEVVFTAADGLDGPSSAAFGRGQDRHMLYISNAQFPFFPSSGNGPSVMVTELPVGGYPLR